MTADECQRRAEEAKALAAQTRDLWEREAFLRVTIQWYVVAAHKATKESKQSQAASVAQYRSIWPGLKNALVSWVIPGKGATL